MISKWIRIIHRWLVIPLLLVVIVLMMGSITQGAGFQTPNWLGAIGALSLLSLALTGLYMFAQHYWAKWRRGQRNLRSQAVAGSAK